MLIKGIAFSIFFVLFITLSSFYPDWLHYISYTGPKTPGSENVLLDVASLIVSLVVGALSYVSLAKIKNLILRVLKFLQKAADQSKK
jgi:hypothetical protein